MAFQRRIRIFLWITPNFHDLPLTWLHLALDPVKGVSLGFIRRLRDLAWAALGLAVLGAFQSSRTRPQPAPLDASSR